MANNNHYKAEQFINAIPGTGGIISTIAKRVGCDWHTAKRYINDYATIAKAYKDECEAVLDMAESILIGNIKDGDSSDAKWYLARKGRDRGYVERQEIETGDINIRIIRDGTGSNSKTS